MSDQTTPPRNLEPQAGSTPTPSINEAANELRAATTAKVREIASVAEAKASAFKAAATETAQQVKDSTVEHWHDTSVKAKELCVSSDDYIRQNPTKSVLCALGLGFLVGLIVRR